MGPGGTLHHPAQGRWGGLLQLAGRTSPQEARPLMGKAFLKRKRTWKLTEGSNLTQSVTTGNIADGGELSVEFVTDFDPAGGVAVFEPDTVREEVFLYS